MGKQKKHGITQNQFQDSASDRQQMPSRVAKRQTTGKKEKKNRNFLLPSLFFIFILIPVTILFYVAFVYEPDDMLQTAANENEVSVETNNGTSDSVVVADEDEEESEPSADDESEKAAEEKAAKEQAEKEKAEKEKAAKEQAAKEQAAKEQAAKEQAAKEEAQRIAAEKAKAEEEARKQREREEAEKEKAQSPSQRTHTVQASETLYRIAVNYYGTGDAVDKIKAANGLTSNEISVGQTLVLP